MFTNQYCAQCPKRISPTCNRSSVDLQDDYTKVVSFFWERRDLQLEFVVCDLQLAGVDKLPLKRPRRRSLR